MKYANVLEVTASMISDSKNLVPYEDYFLLGDNIDGEDCILFNYEGIPVKLMFTCILFCLEGKIRIRIGFEELEVAKNEWMVIPSGSIIDKVEYEQCCRLMAIYVADYHRHFLPNNRIRIMFERKLGYEPSVFRINSQIMKYIVTQYNILKKALSDETLKYKDEVIEGGMMVIGTCLMSEIDESASKSAVQKLSHNEQLFKQFITLVKQDYALHREVMYYAEKLCITPKYLGVVITRFSGRRPIDWIRDYVILDAKAMLLSKSYTIQQISEQLHFSTPSFFCKYFKEKVGCSPGKYVDSLTLK